MKLLIAGAVLIILVIVIGLPLAAIWALNTLFATRIIFTFWTWLAMLIVLFIVSASSASRKK